MSESQERNDLANKSLKRIPSYSSLLNELLSTTQGKQKMACLFFCGGLFQQSDYSLTPLSKVPQSQVSSSTDSGNIIVSCNTLSHYNYRVSKLLVERHGAKMY